MKVRVGDYKIETDSYNFIVKNIYMADIKNEAGEVIRTEEKEKIVGYTGTLEQALSLVRDRILFDNDDLKEISRKLTILSIKIGGIKSALERVVKSE